MIYEWSDSLAVGHPQIDAEHRCLIAIINRLAAAISDEVDDDLVGTTLCELSAYTSSHFEHEEREMQRLYYSGYLRHKGQHEAFIQRLSDLVFSFEVRNEGLKRETLAMLTEWLIEHIGIEDRKLVQVLREMN